MAAQQILKVNVQFATPRGVEVRHTCCNVTVDDERFTVTSRNTQQVVGIYALAGPASGGWNIEDRDGSTVFVRTLAPG